MSPQRSAHGGDTHCDCDGSAGYANERLRIRRQREARQRAQLPGMQQPTANEVRERYARAEEAGKSGGARPSKAAEAERAEMQGEDEDNEDTFEAYESLHFTLGQRHPDPVVETTSLSFANLPDDIDQELDLPSALFRPKSAANPLGGALSRLQLETVAYASRRHATDLPSGERSGFFLGDGVGLGKGRQLAGLILHNMRAAQGNGAAPLRRRHVWVSVSQDLLEDARRDLKDIGAASVPLHSLARLPYGKIDQMPARDGSGGRICSGVLFVTYSALVSRSRESSRLKQVVGWLGGDCAEGCILFDESHKAKNLTLPAASGAAPGGKVKKDHSSKTASAGDGAPTPHPTPRGAPSPPPLDFCPPRLSPTRRALEPRGGQPPCTSCRRAAPAPASSTARPPGRRTSGTWHTWGGSACGAQPPPSRASTISRRRLAMAGSGRWNSWRLT